MRLLKNGVSAVVAASFVLFFAGLSFGQGTIDINGTVITVPVTMTGGEPGDAPKVKDALVRVVGTNITCLTDNTEPDSGKYTVTIPAEQETFVLKVTKEDWVTTYTLPDGVVGGTNNNDGYGYVVVLFSDAQLNAFYSDVSAARDPAKSTLMVFTSDPSITEGNDWVYGATARVRNSEGNEIIDSGDRKIRYIYFKANGNPGFLSAPSIATGTETFGYVVFNLPVGSYTNLTSKIE